MTILRLWVLTFPERLGGRLEPRGCKRNAVAAQAINPAAEKAVSFRPCGIEQETAFRFPGARRCRALRAGRGVIAPLSRVQPASTVGAILRRRQQGKEQTMSENRPTHRAYVVTKLDKPTAKGRDSLWHEVGAVWPHKNGGGFDVVLIDGISVGGRIVCTPPKDKDETGSD